MKILVTGANGFIGKNLCLRLVEDKHKVLKFESKDTDDTLKEMIKNCDFVMHLAGVNRPLTTEEFYDGNVNFTLKLVNHLKSENRSIPILFSSSIQALQENDYGKSKKQAEQLIFEYGNSTASNVYVFRLANAFGKWSKPNYNSVVATFCYNITHCLDIIINDRNKIVPFVYIDDIIKEFILCIKKNGCNDILNVNPVYDVSLGDLADLLYSFKESRSSLFIQDMGDEFTKKLYSTYLSYLPENEFSYNLKMNVDNRGYFTEILKSECNGQVSINLINPGFVKGNHWHHSKNEKFLVVSGEGIIRFRKIGDDRVIEYKVSSQNLEMVDIPTGYTHNIENIGNTDMVVVMWCNELYDCENPDTYYEEV